MRFEWDAGKEPDQQTETRRPQFRERGPCVRRSSYNLRKDRVVAGERRWHAIGMATGALLLVVHADRLENEHDKEETIRIISACEANKRERRIYIQQAAE
jgi:uncharacterized DUF497 family protein